MNINAVQILGWTVGGCALLAGASSGAQLTELFGGNIAGKVAAGAGLLGGLLAVPLGSLATTFRQTQYVASRANEPAVQAALTDAVVANKNVPAVQTALVTAVASYPGVNPIQTNVNASQALRDVANDQDVPKVLPPSVDAAVKGSNPR